MSNEAKPQIWLDWQSDGSDVVAQLRIRGAYTEPFRSFTAEQMAEALEAKAAELRAHAVSVKQAGFCA